MSGASVSTVKERVAGVGSTLPAGSVARTSKVWAPSASATVGVWAAPGPLQGANTAASKRHSKVDPVSVEEKPKVGVESLVGPEAPEVIVVFGAWVSTVKARVAGVESSVAGRSLWRAPRSCGRPRRAPRSACGSRPGPLQGAKAAASKRHSKVDPVSLAEKPKVGVESFVGPVGPEVIVVSGATESST